MKKDDSGEVLVVFYGGELIFFLLDERGNLRGGTTRFVSSYGQEFVFVMTKNFLDTIQFIRMK